MKIILIILLLFPNIIYAYENKIFDINIPENMILLTEENNIYKWAFDKDEKIPNLSIVISKNNDYNIDLFNEEDTKNYEQYVKDKLNEELKEFDINVDVYGSKIEQLNDFKTLIYTTKWNTKESFGYDTYQKAYTFTTNKYLISLTFETKNEEELNKEEFKNIINSFNIKDDKIKIDYTKDLIYFLAFIIAGGLAGLTFSVIKNKIRSKKNDK